MSVSAGPGSSRTIHLRLLNLDALRREAQGEETAIAHDAKVGRGGDGDAGVVVGRVLDGVGVVALSAELKHCSHGGGGRGRCEGASGRALVTAASFWRWTWRLAPDCTLSRVGGSVASDLAVDN